MFGNSFFGAYYGDGYFGPGSVAAPVVISDDRGGGGWVMPAGMVNEPAEDYEAIRKWSMAAKKKKKRHSMLLLDEDFELLRRR